MSRPHHQVPEARSGTPARGRLGFRMGLLTMAVLLIAAGCTFERRPAIEEDGAAGDTAAPASEATGLGVPSDQAVDEARAFFRAFQDARRDGRMSEVRSRLHPRALLVRGVRPLSRQASDADVEAFLTSDGSGGAGPDAVEEVEALASAVLILVRYPPDDTVAGSVVETVLLVRDSSGWSVRLLQRVLEGRAEGGP